VTVSTRSGSNTWHGGTVAEYQAEAWNGSNTPGGRDSTVTVRQQDLGVGGPLLRNRWWVFASGRVARNATGNPRSATQLSYLRQVEPGAELAANRWSGQFVFAKVTGQPWARHAALASFSRDVVTLGGAQPNEAGTFREVRAGGPGVFGRLSSVWSDALLTHVAVGYNGKKQENRNLAAETTGVLVHEAAFPSGGRLLGTGPIAAVDASAFPGTDFDADMWTATADVTFLHVGAGSHQVVGGVYAQPLRRSRWITYYNHGGFQLEEAALNVRTDAGSGFTAFHRQMFDVANLVSRHVDTADVAGYVQDAWTVASRVTVNAGIRIDAISRRDRLFDVVTQRTTAIGPRLGVAFSPDRDRRSVLRANWGRIHDNPTLNDTVAGATVAGVRDLYDTAHDGSFGTVIVTPPSTARAPDLIIDLEHYRQPRVDETMVGYRRQLPWRTTVDVNGVRREYRDRAALVETNGIYAGNRFVGYHDESRNGVFRLTSNVWNWPVVTALQASVVHQTANLQLIAGYTRSWNHMVGSWQPNDPASLIQPDAFANARGIGFLNGCTSGGAACPDANSLSEGGGGTWRDRLVNAAAVASLAGSIRVAVSYTLQSGPWSGPILTTTPASDPQFGPPTVALSNGRVVANPLATTIRFAYPTRAEGQLRLPDMHLLNVRAGRRFGVAGRRLDVWADVLNVTNAGADQAFPPTATQTYSPFFGQGTARQYPRAVKVSARLAF
jgi:hypothetical protein